MIFLSGLVTFYMRLSPDKIAEEDLKFAPVNADLDFDPQHNKRVIENVIRKTKENKVRIEKENREGIKERTAAISQYLSSLDQGGKSSTIESYFGRRELARLRGEEAMARIKNAMLIKNKEGKQINA